MAATKWAGSLWPPLRLMDGTALALASPQPAAQVADRAWNLPGGTREGSAFGIPHRSRFEGSRPRRVAAALADWGAEPVCVAGRAR